MTIPASLRVDKLGHSVVIGWNETRESARAAHDSMAVLQEGDTAHILRVNDSSHAMEMDNTSNDLAAALARHGINTTIVHKTWEQPGVAVAISKEAVENGADMIAIGAFGHSLAYHVVIGAASRDLLRSPTLPVMFSR